MMYRIKQYLDMIAYPWYVLSGKVPWSPGYTTAKRRAIVDSVKRSNSGLFDDPETGYGYRIDERVVEYPWVLGNISKNIEPGSKLLDAGSALNHKYLLSSKPLTDIQLTICTLGPEKRCYWKYGVSYVYDDLRDTMFRSCHFDCVVSISTIEHIGLDNTLLYTDDASKRESDQSGYLMAVREFKRILKPGGTCYITVPYGKAVVRGWFQIFDASMVAGVVEAFDPSEVSLEYFAYSAEGWKKADPSELEAADFHDIHQDGKPRGDMAAGARGLVCMKLRS